MAIGYCSLFEAGSLPRVDRGSALAVHGARRLISDQLETTTSDLPYRGQRAGGQMARSQRA